MDSPCDAIHRTVLKRFNRGASIDSIIDDLEGLKTIWRSENMQKFIDQEIELCRDPGQIRELVNAENLKPEKLFTIRIKWVEHCHGDVEVKAKTLEEAVRKAEKDLSENGHESATFQTAVNRTQFESYDQIEVNM
jgi:hypothetical protein